MKKQHSTILILATLGLVALLCSCEDTAAPQPEESLAQTDTATSVEATTEQQDTATEETTTDDAAATVDSNNLSTDDPQTETETEAIADTGTVAEPEKWITVPDNASFDIPSDYQYPYGLYAGPKTALSFSVQSAEAVCDLADFPGTWTIAVEDGTIDYTSACSCQKSLPARTTCTYTIPAGHSLDGQLRLEHRASSTSDPDSVQLYFIRTK